MTAITAGGRQQWNCVRAPLAIATGVVTEVIVLAGAVAEMTSQPAYADGGGGCSTGNC